MYDGTPYYRTITGVMDRSGQVQGSTACHYGATTGYSCGIIQANDVCRELRGVTGCKWVTVRNANSASGDSGGPWYSGSWAYGIHSGTSDLGNIFYMPVSNMLDKGYTIMTSSQ